MAPQSQRDSHSLLLDRGFFRVSLPWPPKDVAPDFRIDAQGNYLGSDDPGVNPNVDSTHEWRRLPAASPR